MRVVVVCLVLAACVGGVDTKLADNETNPTTEPGVGGGGLIGCSADSDCVAVAPTCCECPTFAVHADDPLAKSCSGVDCTEPGDACTVTGAICQAGTCVLACAAVACTETHASGYAVDASGCLSCAAATPDTYCTAASDCVQTRADCCGCAGGGMDTAVPATMRGSYDDMLACPSDPLCPGTNTCDAGEQPVCAQGRCELLAPLPANACGRPDLPACPAGTICTVNVDPVATAHGVGVCR